MIINKRMVESITRQLNTPVKIVHVCQRNGYWAVDNALENECYHCGMSTRECYLFLKGMKIGLNFGLNFYQEGDGI